MAASYSSFLSSPFYSPIFNTALFDGPFRIYFSQSYEAVALKIYHLLQSEEQALCQSIKKWSERTKSHVFILIYPTKEDVHMAFVDQDAEALPLRQTWDEGFAIGMNQPPTDDVFHEYFKSLTCSLTGFVGGHEKPQVKV
jgi:hypothetical protein